MLNAIYKTILLKDDISWQDFDYPLIWVWLLIILMGTLSGITLAPDDIPLPLVLNIVFDIVLTVSSFVVMAWFMRWWMTRRGCDCENKMLRLIAATAFIDLIATILILLGIPTLFLLPMFLFSYWVAAHALEQTCNDSVGYAIIGLLLSIIPVLFTTGVIGIVVSIIAIATGIDPPPTMQS